VTATLETDDVGELSESAPLTICAIVREALATTVRHAGPRQARVTARRERDAVVTTATNDVARPISPSPVRAGTGETAVAQAKRARPDIALMDIRMPGRRRERGHASHPTPKLVDTRVLVLSMRELDEYVHGPRAGASGFLLMGAEPGQLVEAIRRTYAGESLFDPSILAH